MKGLAFIWVALLMMWCFGLWGVYLRGSLDSLHWSVKLDEWILKGDRNAPMPENEVNWREVLSYIVPLLLLTLFVGWFTLTLVEGN